MAPRTSGYAVYVLALMVGINFLNYVDRWVGSAVAPLIQAEFDLNDFSLGLLGGAFTLVYALAALPFGLWADRGVRKTIIGTGVAIWSLATLFTALTANYIQLFLARAALGIGEASHYAPGTSLLADYFPRDRRGRAMSIWSAGSALGIAVGFAGGGLVADRFGWRTAFLAAAAPGLVLAVLAFRVREPLRGAAEDSGPRRVHAGEASLKRMLRLFEVRSLRWMILSQTPVFFVLGANAYWLPTFLARRFDMSVSSAGSVAGAVLVLGGLIGTLLGGWLADWRRRHSSRADLEVSMVGFLGGAVFISLALLAPFGVFLPAFLLTVVCLFLYSGPYTVIGQNVVAPTLRASAVTLAQLVSHVFGDSYAPAAVGYLSDALGGLQIALLLVSPTLLVLGAAIAALAFRTIESDVAAVDRAWALRQT